MSDNKKEPNPNWVEVKAEKRLELAVEFDGSFIRCGVLVDGKPSFGGEGLPDANDSLLKFALDHFFTLYQQSKPKRPC